MKEGRLFLPLADGGSLGLVVRLPTGFGASAPPTPLGCTRPQVLGRFDKILKLKHSLLRIKRASRCHVSHTKTVTLEAATGSKAHSLWNQPDQCLNPGPATS